MKVMLAQPLVISQKLAVIAHWQLNSISYRYANDKPVVVVRYYFVPL